MTSDGMYGSRAPLYEVLYSSFKDYLREAADIRRQLVNLGVPHGSRVLEAACGTGAHLEHLRTWFDVCGFDLAQGMLAVAKGRLPGVPLFRADMAAFEVARPFDAVLCLFSSVGYLTSEEKVAAAARCFLSAVRPGGVVLVEPWLAPENWTAGHPSLQVAETDDLKVARACVSAREGDCSTMAFRWMVARRGAAEVETFEERHELLLLPHERLIEIFEEAGGEVEYDPKGITGRGLLVIRRGS